MIAKSLSHHLARDGGAREESSLISFSLLSQHHSHLEKEFVCKVTMPAYRMLPFKQQSLEGSFHSNINSILFQSTQCRLNYLFHNNFFQTHQLRLVRSQSVQRVQVSQSKKLDQPNMKLKTASKS